eukprot:6458339-Amphidinium_carterae.3
MPRKCTVDQLAAKAVREQESARKHLHLSRKARINVIMTEHPALVQPILEAAEELVVAVNQSPEAATSVARGGARPALVPDQNARALELKVEIDKHAHKVSKLTLDDLKCILYEINEFRFSAFQLKALKEKSHQRDVSKDTLCKVLEFVTSVGGDTELGTGFFKSREDVLNYVKLQQAQLGTMDRSAVLPLPPDWSQHGIYRITEKTVEHILVAHKFSNLIVTVPNSEFDNLNLLWDASELASLVIEQNWSACNAKLVVKGTPKGALLSRFFRLDGSLVSRQLALQAGEPEGVGEANGARKRKHDDTEGKEEHSEGCGDIKIKICNKMAAFMKKHTDKAKQAHKSSESTTSGEQGTPSAKSDSSGGAAQDPLSSLLAEKGGNDDNEQTFQPPPPTDV